MHVVKMKKKVLEVIRKSVVATCFYSGLLFTQLPNTSSSADAFPIYAQQAYPNPREANGRIVCANCHLAQKPVELEAPQAVLPNQVFETVVKIPYDTAQKQILGSGKKGGLNVGAVLVLPEGFKLAPKNSLSEELKAKTKSVYVTPYSPKQENILVVGPIAGEKNQEIIFPILSPDPATDKSVHFLKYPLFVGGNRGRAQVNPTGDKTNNNALLALGSGKVTTLEKNDKGNFIVKIEDTNGKVVEQTVPAEYNLLVKKGDLVRQDQQLTLDPNVGGFGQTEKEIVLQDPSRIVAFVAFSVLTMLTQTMLVLKKKQFEKVQAAEMNF